MAREVFVDADAWIAVINQRDEYHAEAAAFYERLLREKRPLVTTNLVIAEAYAMIRRYSGYQPAIGFLDSLRQSGRLTRVYSDAALEAEKTLRRHADQDFSLADAVSFLVMQQRGITEAFAFDDHCAAVVLSEFRLFEAIGAELWMEGQHGDVFGFFPDICCECGGSLSHCSREVSVS